MAQAVVAALAAPPQQCPGAQEAVEVRVEELAACLVPENLKLGSEQEQQREHLCQTFRLCLCPCPSQNRFSKDRQL